MGLSGAWSAYRTWAATARYHKTAIDFLTRWGLWLALAGALLATIGDQIARFAPKEGPEVYLFRGPGMLAAGLIALASYISGQALSGDRDKIWIRCRAAAESIKSSIHLYRAAVPPFDTANRTVELSQRIEKTLQDMKDIQTRPPDASETKPALDALTVDNYIDVRVVDQINWYRKRAREFQEESDRYSMIVQIFGGIGAALGIVAAATGVAAWLAVIATVTTAITAYVKNQRYQTLIGVYLATAARLELLKDQWLDSGKTEADKTDRDSFIQRCEETLALENSAWVAQWKDQKQPPQPPAAAVAGSTPLKPAATTGP